MASKPGKGTATIHRLLDERRRYEAWLTRIRSTAEATPEHVRTRVEADYTARLKAVNEELKVHAEAAKQLIAQRAETIAELRAKEAQAAERLSEGELRHTVGEYDEEAWTQFRKDSLAELMSVREELQELESDLSQLQEVSELVTTPRAGDRPVPKAGPPPRPQSKPEPKAEPREKKVDELAFIKSVTEDEKKGPSPRRASGAQFQPSEPAAGGSARSAGATEEPLLAQKTENETPRTLRCPECGTMNMPTEWYCEQCGAELAAL